MKMLFKITLEETKTLLRGVDFDIEYFNINFYDGTSIKFCELDTILKVNNEYVMYSSNSTTLKYARRILEAYCKGGGKYES